MFLARQNFSNEVRCKTYARMCNIIRLSSLDAVLISFHYLSILMPGHAHSVYMGENNFTNYAMIMSECIESLRFSLEFFVTFFSVKS